MVDNLRLLCKISVKSIFRNRSHILVNLLFTDFISPLRLKTSDIGPSFVSGLVHLYTIVVVKVFRQIRFLFLTPILVC